MSMNDEDRLIAGTEDTPKLATSVTVPTAEDADNGGKVLEDDSDYEERLKHLKLVASTMQHAANEILILARLEPHFDPAPAHIAGTDKQIKALSERTDRLCHTFGGPPPLLILQPGQPRPRYDTYVSAATDETVLMFLRARSAVCRAHLHFIGGAMIERDPQLLVWPPDEKIAATFQRLTIDQFWEHAETAYIKLASLWDRLGQLLDFCFFNIRQYERDGFPAVLDRIHSNYVPLSQEIRESSCWIALRKFQSSEKTDGLGWLLRRRNLIIHSMHLRPSEDDVQDDPIFDSAYNHLEERVRKKLATGSKDDELNFMHQQLAQAAELFPAVLTLCELGANPLLRPRASQH